MTADADRHHDDLDGAQGARPVRFSVDGTNYLIYLTDANTAALRQALAPWVIAARRLGKSHGRRRAH